MDLGWGAGASVSRHRFFGGPGGAVRTSIFGPTTSRLAPHHRRRRHGQQGHSAWSTVIERARKAGRNCCLIPGLGDRPRVGRRRRRLGLLEGAGGLRRDQGAALLGPQDRQRLNQMPIPAGQSQGPSARHLDGGLGPTPKPPSHIAAYGAKYHKAAERLVKDRERLRAIYDFPASTGSTSAPPTPSKAPSPRCA